MPLPRPLEDESREVFVDRCMASDAMEEFEGEKQRFAVCAEAWDEAQEDEQIEMFCAPMAQLEAQFESKPGRRYRMTAYTGDAVDLGGRRIVFDLSGVELGSESIPILRQHDPEMIVGHSTSVSIDAEQIVVELQVSDSTASGREVLELFADGFPWQASIGVVMTEIEDIAEGDEVTVNGRAFTGPLGVVRRSTLREASFVPLGADAATSVAALAAKLRRQQGEDRMSESKTPEQIRTECAQELRELVDALPGRLNLAVDSYLAGHSVTEAKAALADVLLAELAAKDVELEAANNDETRAAIKRELAAELRRPVDASTDQTTAPPPVATVKMRWDEAMSAQLSAGVSRPDAVSNIIRKNPELQAELIAAANNSRKG